MPERGLHLHVPRQHRPSPHALPVENPGARDRDSHECARGLIARRARPIVTGGADTSFRRHVAIALLQCDFFYARTPSAASPPLWWESRNRKAGACPEQVSAPTASEALTGFDGGAIAMPIQEAA